MGTVPDMPAYGDRKRAADRAAAGATERRKGDGRGAGGGREAAKGAGAEGQWVPGPSQGLSETEIQVRLLVNPPLNLEMALT